MPDPLVLDLLRSRDALEALRPEWQRLHGRCRDATPFQSPEWLIPWWDAFGEGDLCAWAARANGQLVALAPFYVWTAPDAVRTLLLLGAGTSDYLDILCAPDQAHAFCAALFDALRDEDWHIAELAQLRASSPLLHAPFPRDWREHRTNAEPCPSVKLAPSSSLEDCIAKRMAQNLRYYRRRAERLGDLTIRSATDDPRPFFERLITLHGVRWSTRGASGVLAEERVRAAHRAALPHLARGGMLRFYELLIGGDAAASLYALDDARPGGRVYYYLGGFDPRFAEASPGNLLIGHAISEAIRAGACAFDFLRGQERYKYLWGATDDATSHVRITRERN